MKKHIWKSLAASVLGASLLTGLPWAAAVHGNDATVQSYEDQMADLAAKQEQALAELQDLYNTQSEAQLELGKYDELLKYNNEMKNLASGQLDSLYAQIQEKTQSIEETTEALETQEQAFLDRMVAVYMEEDTDYLELLFESEDLTDFLTRMELVSAVFDYDDRIINGLSENKASLEADKANLDYAQETQLKRVKEYEQVIKENQQLYDAKLEYMENLKTNESDLISEYSYYKQQEDELNAELEAYLAELARQAELRRQEEERKRQEAIAAQKAAEEAERKRQEELAAQQQQYWDDYYNTSSSSIDYTEYTGGTITYPLDPDVYSYMSSPYGWRVLYGIEEFHLGVDLACAAGTDVLAAASGTVVLSQYHYSYGNYVIIDHGNGFSTLYAHLSSSNVNVGDFVGAGQTIGWVGLTGHTYGYHLHFETREYGSTVDPEGYLW
ncbi:MAG: peptidoglycan DD-metalloendopeptidase family protein [Clostridia bacterium]|nr:peptidoglycan DD-metalloendopeptidase family protein [Clostridia bacterium]